MAMPAVIVAIAAAPKIPGPAALVPPPLPFMEVSPPSDPESSDISTAMVRITVPFKTTLTDVAPMGISDASNWY